MILKCGRSRAKLPTLPAGDFPMILMDPTSAGGAVGPSAVLRLLTKTEFAMSTDQARYHINGVYLHVAATDDGPMLRAVATDGHRMAVCEAPAGEDFTGFPGVIVPGRTVDEARKLLDGASEAVLRASATKIEFAAGGANLASKVIDGTFPDYLRVIPRSNPHRVGLDVTELQAALKRLMVVADDKDRSLRIEIEGGMVKISNRSVDNGNLAEELETDFDGPPINVGLNARYFADVANRIDGERLDLHFGDHAEPILALGPTDKRLRFVLMTQRV